MSDKKHIFEDDLLMRSILEGGQEEVPARVWDAVSKRLEKDAGVVAKDGGRVATEGGVTAGPVIRLWWRRAGIAVAAAAAAVVAVLLIDRPQTLNIVPADAQGDMIAVVEPAAAATDIESTGAEESRTYEQVVSKTSGAELLAYAPKMTEITSHSTLPSKLTDNESTEDISQDTTAPVTESAEILSQPVEELVAETTISNITGKSSEDAVANSSWYTDDIWEDEKPARQMKTSFVVSGITGAGNTRSSSGTGILKAPSVILTPTKTGIREKENQTTYGIPVAVGVGARIELSPRWSLGVGLNYTNLTRTLSGTYTHVNEAGSIDDMVTSQIRNSQHYIGIPVNAYFKILNNKRITFYTYAGGTAEKCLSDKYHILTNNVIHKEAVKGVQLSAAAGFGAEFMLTDYLGFYIDPSLRYYFDCDQPRSVRTAQPLMFSAELGLRFKL